MNNRKDVEDYFNEEEEEEEENRRLLNDPNETSYNGKYGFYNLMRFYSHLLQIGGELAVNALMTLFTFFGKFVPQFGYLFIFPLIATPLQYLYGVSKILLHPLIGWKKKSFLVTALSVASGLIFTALFSGFMANFAKVLVFEVVGPLAPYLFTGALAVYTFLNGMGMVDKAIAWIRNKAERTPLAKWSLITKTIKTASLLTITSLIVPLFVVLGSAAFLGLTNPFTAGPTAAVLFSILMVASATLITLKIVKTVRKHRLQEDMARDALEGIKGTDGNKMKQEPFNPYVLMNITQAQINATLEKPRKLMFLNKRDLKIELEKKYTAAKGHIEAGYRDRVLSPKDEAEKTARLYQLKLAYEMLGNPRGREMFDAFKAVKDLKKRKESKDKTMQPLQERQKQFLVVTTLQKTIPVSWIMRPIAAIIYQVKKSNLGNDEKAKQKLALSYRLATNAALSNYYEEISARRPAPEEGGQATPSIVQKNEGGSAPRPIPGTSLSVEETSSPGTSLSVEETSSPSLSVEETSSFGSGKRSSRSSRSLYSINGLTLHSSSSDFSPNSSLASTPTDASTPIDDGLPRERLPLTYGKYGAS